MWYEHDVVVVLAGKFPASGFCLFFEELPPPFACSVTPADDVGRYLRGVSGVLPEGCLDDGDAFAHRFE